MTGERSLDVDARLEPVPLEVLEEESADQVLLGWRGERRTREYVFGSTVDPVLERAPCEVSIVDLEKGEIGAPVALAGPGPHAPAAARRAAEFAKLSVTKPTLLNAQPSADDGTDPVERGEAAIDDVAEAAGLEPGSYESEVVVTDDVQSAILDTVEEYDTVSAGVSEKSAVSRILFGSIADRLAD